MLLILGWSIAGNPRRIRVCQRAKASTVHHDHPRQVDRRFGKVALISTRYSVTSWLRGHALHRPRNHNHTTTITCDHLTSLPDAAPVWIDPLHTYLGIAGLSLAGEPGIEPLDHGEMGPACGNNAPRLCVLLALPLIPEQPLTGDNGSVDTVLNLSKRSSVRLKERLAARG